MEKFYLGTHMNNWLWTDPLAAPEWDAVNPSLFVSHRRLVGVRNLRPSRRRWALDSGGFSEYSLYGEWRTTPAEYVAAVLRYDRAIGQLEWAAPQDSMCEESMLEKARMTDAARMGRAPVSMTDQLVLHQQRTVRNLGDLEGIWAYATDDESPFIPVIQGDTVDEYLRCVDFYTDASVDLTHYPLVGVGSVCRRQATDEVGDIVQAIKDYVDPELPVHVFGLKKSGIRKYSDKVLTGDSMAWSYDARRADPLPGCTGHKNCANCAEYALRWYKDLTRELFPPAVTA